MFSQQAALKLTDIANAFFTKPGEGSDAKPQKSVSVGERETATPNLTATGMDKRTGGTDGDEVTITGDGFSNTTTVSFGAMRSRLDPKFFPLMVTNVLPVTGPEVGLTASTSIFAAPALAFAL